MTFKPLGTELEDANLLEKEGFLSNEEGAVWIDLCLSLGSPFSSEMADAESWEVIFLIEETLNSPASRNLDLTSSSARSKCSIPAVPLICPSLALITLKPSLT